MAQRPRQQAAELANLRAELVMRLARLDFRSGNLAPALAAMARQAERTVWQLELQKRIERER